MHWKKVALVGVGLLGGSLGQALKQRRLAGTIAGFVRRAASIAECEKHGAVDLATRDLREAVSGAEIIVLCTPILQMRPLVEEMLPALEAGAILTDVGSVKGSVVRDLERLAGTAGVHFIGSHPMAGAEKNGVAAARADLFVNAVCVVTPTRKSDPEAVRQIERLWEAVGGRLLRLAPEDHDALVSRSSHLPHVVAAGLANLVLDPRRPKAQARLCANGFRDTTRIASGTPEMWRDIALANRKHLSQALATFLKDLQSFRRAVAKGDAQALQKYFESAKKRRDKWSGKLSSASPE